VNLSDPCQQKLSLSLFIRGKQVEYVVFFLAMILGLKSLEESQGIFVLLNPVDNSRIIT
jgi:hypothetical protein